MGHRQPEVERLAQPVPEIYKELYRRKLVEGLEALAETMDETLGVNGEDEIDRKRWNLMLAVEASYIAIEATLDMARCYIYKKKLRRKVDDVRDSVCSQ